MNLKTLITSALLVAFASSAEAALITRSFTLSATPDIEQRQVIAAGTLDRRFRRWNLDPLDFTLEAGDIVETSITFTSALTILGGFPSASEVFAVVYSAGELAGPGGWTRSRTTVTEIGGATGGFLGDPPSFTGSFTFPEGAEINISSLASGNVTDTAMALTTLTFIDTYTVIDPQADPFALGVLLINDDLQQISVPSPGAFLLLGVGLVGLCMRRRTA